MHLTGPLTCGLAVTWRLHDPSLKLNKWGLPKSAAALRGAMLLRCGGTFLSLPWFLLETGNVVIFIADIPYL